MISAWQIFFSILFVLLTWMFNKVKEIYTQLNKRNNKIPDIKVLEKIIPLSNDIGWKVKTVKNGVPLWKYQSTFTFAPCNLYGCRALLQGKPEAILAELLDMRIFNTIFSQFPSLKKEACDDEQASKKDILSLSNINTDLSLTSIMTSHHKSFTLERHWSQNKDKSWLYMYPRSTLLSNKYGYWICFFLQELSFDNSCLLHIISTYPASTGFSYIAEHLSACLVLCREHMDSLCLLKLKDKYPDNSIDNLKKTVSPKTEKTKPEEIVKTAIIDNVVTPKKKLGEEVFGLVEEPAVITRIASTERLASTEIQNTVVASSDTVPPVEENKSKFSYDEELAPYEKKLLESFDRIYEIYQAGQDTLGWESLGVKEGVQIFKKDGDNLSPAGTYKGIAKIQVPLPYLLNYCHNLEYRNEFDTLFDVGYDIVTFKDGVTKVNNLLYQNVWPTTGRDFCSITAIRHLKDNLFASVVTATIHPKCPERSNKVRGEVIIAGYVFKEISVEPPLVELTYVTRADLKGSIPQAIKNRVNAEQPLLAGRIRKHCEQRFKRRDPDNDGKDIYDKIRAVPSMFEEPTKNVSSVVEQPNNIEKESAINETDVVEREEVISTASNVDDVLATSTPQPGRKETDNEEPGNKEPVNKESGNEEPNFILDSGFNLKENHYSKSTDYDERKLELPTRRLTNDDSLMGDSESVGDLSQVEFTEDQTHISISEQALELPRDAYGKIDYLTLGNQAAAQLEEEFIIAKSVNEKTGSNNQEQTSDNWIYQSTTKGVEILRKVHSTSKFHSFLARGIINALPVTVWEAIKNPTTRFVYDNMLKKTTVVKEISDRHRILHMRHETTACFVRQARDFCLLNVERVEQQRYMLIGTSVELPECPPVRDCVRGRVLSSGWIIEPTLRNGRYCSAVTYITQIDFGGRLPTRVINFIAKRQPLSLAYLREFLESSEF